MTSILVLFCYGINTTAVPLVLWHCWLCDNKSVWPEKPTIPKVLLWETFWVPASPGVISG